MAGLPNYEYETTYLGLDVSVEEAKTDAFWASLLDGDDQITVLESTIPSLYGHDINSGAGNDVITFADELNTFTAVLDVDGGGGQDLLSFAQASGPLLLDLEDPEAFGTGFDAPGLRFVSNVETIVGTAFDDTILGDDEDNEFDGGGGDDALSGRDGDDRLFGGSGDDRLQGGSGRDALFGGAGGDRIGGGDGADGLFGGGGRDRLLAGGNDDYVEGGRADDYLFGQAGDDELLGGGGDDVFVGGSGDDYLEGGAGRDSIVFRDDASHDTVVGFVSGEDQIDLTFLSGEPGDLSEALVETDAGVLLTIGSSTLLFDGLGLAQIDIGTDFLFA